MRYDLTNYDSSLNWYHIQIDHHDWHMFRLFYFVNLFYLQDDGGTSTLHFLSASIILQEVWSEGTNGGNTVEE